MSIYKKWCFRCVPLWYTPETGAPVSKITADRNSSAPGVRYKYFVLYHNIPAVEYIRTIPNKFLTFRLIPTYCRIVTKKAFRQNHADKDGTFSAQVACLCRKLKSIKQEKLAKLLTMHMRASIDWVRNMLIQ